MNLLLQQTLSPSRMSCGGLGVRVEGEACILRCSGAMLVPSHGLLIVADLHLEKGSAFAVRGQMLPPYDTAATLVRLEEEIEALNPTQVVLLGDSFHDRNAVSRLSASDRERLGRMAAGRDWIWLEGNHDREALGAPELGLPGRVIDQMKVSSLNLVHEPEPGERPGEVAGHLHPSAHVSAYGRGVRRPCFVTDGRRIVLPAFGAFTGGLNVKDQAFSDLFSMPPLAAALGNGRIHPLAWTSLR